MIQIGDKLISIELFEVDFYCHLELCHGNCCVYGDSGAPLEEHEAGDLERYYPRISNYITENGRRSIEEQGKWVIDSDGDKVTPLIKGKECTYTYFKNNTAFCGIEKAFEKGKIPFQKPLSCHLYPVRVSRVGDLTALNYHHWPICDPARKLGRKKGIPVFRFVKNALIRAYGQKFYDELETIYQQWLSQQSV